MTPLEDQAPPWREPYTLSFRRPGRSFLARFAAHLLIRLLVVGTLPANLQATLALFPMSLLWPLVAVQQPAALELEPTPNESGAVASVPAGPKTRVWVFSAQPRTCVGEEGEPSVGARRGYGRACDGTASDSSIARFYDPTTARFTSQDSFLGSIDNPPSLHRYFYAADNPTRYVDEDGHEAGEANPAAPEPPAAGQDPFLRDQDSRMPWLAERFQAHQEESQKPVVIVEDHGIIGNAVDKTLDWVASTRAAQKLARLSERLDEFGDQAGSAVAGAWHSMFGSNRSAEAGSGKTHEEIQARGANERDQSILAEKPASTVAKRGVNEGGEVVRAGVKEGAPILLTGGAAKLGGTAIGMVGRTAGRIADDIPMIFRKDAAILAKKHATFLHDEYAKWTLGPNARQRTFKTPWSASHGQGTRRFDGFNRATGTYFEANTTPWSQMSQEQLSRKLTQVGSDWTLMQSNREVKRVIWFGTEELPTTGLGAQLREGLAKAGIQYWVVRP